jgi:cytochrome c-type biogenesis protein CcmH
MKKIIVGFLLSFISFYVVASTEQYPFENNLQRQQFQRLSRELRCLVCQNQDLADSNASLAKDLKSLVYQKVIAHESDSEIKAFLTQRYGDFILFKPPIKQQTYLLWFGPLLMLLLGLFVLYRFVMRMRSDD